MRRRAKSWLSVAVLVLAPGWAAGAALHGRASTVFQWWEQPWDDHDVAPITQYLSMSATDLVAGQSLSIQGYGQAGKDLASGDPWRGKVFYLYADWNDVVKDRIDLRAGRQFAQNAAGSAVVDGLAATVKLGSVAVGAFGGGDVQFDERYRNGDAALGLSVALDGFDHTFAEVAAFSKLDHWDETRTILGASASQDLWKWGRVYGDVQYDTLGDVFNEVLAGLRFYPVSGWVLTGEYYEALPVFDTTSIYSVFATEKYQEGRLKASWDVLPNVRVYGEVARAWFEEGDRANEGQIGTRVFDVYRTRLDVALSRRRGYGGDLDGVRAVLGHEFLPDRLSAEAGIEHNTFQREEQPDEDRTAGWWGLVEYHWTKSLATSARVENIRDADGVDRVEGILRADWDF